MKFQKKIINISLVQQYSHPKQNNILHWNALWLADNQYQVILSAGLEAFLTYIFNTMDQVKFIIKTHKESKLSFDHSLLVPFTGIPFLLLL